MGEFGAAEEIAVEKGALSGKASAFGKIVMALLAAAVLTASAAPVATGVPGISGVSDTTPGLEGATPVEAPAVDLVCEGGCPIGDAGEMGDETSPFPEGYVEEDQECTGGGCAVDPESAIMIDPLTGKVVEGE
ncbi:hypothetical protein [Herbidospora mongoliensis]|uniref:hypothetical protein n=1 Tax=Herbidospora mongoliensis TaxID=688067 RepID=UPI000837145B|nr:hypothetical protein [Herbidospora mongoliensis]